MLVFVPLLPSLRERWLFFITMLENTKHCSTTISGEVEQVIETNRGSSPLICLVESFQAPSWAGPEVSSLGVQASLACVLPWWSHWHHPRRRRTYHWHHGRPPAPYGVLASYEDGGDPVGCGEVGWSLLQEEGQSGVRGVSLSLRKCCGCFVRQALSQLLHPFLKGFHTLCFLSH